MKICVPTETRDGLSATVFGHFGSAPFFTIYDTANKMVEIVENANEHHSHGMCHPMSALTGKDIDAVVTGGAGARAVQKLNEGGIKVFQSIPGTVADIAEQLTQGGLKEITVQNACVQHDCH